MLNNEDEAKRNAHKITELTGQRNWEDALVHAEDYVAKFPESGNATLILWNILMTLGDLESAVVLLKQREQKQGLSERLFSRYIFSLHGSSAATRDEIREVHRVFAERFFSAKLRSPKWLASPPKRIGLISGEMWNHASSCFLLPLLRGLVGSQLHVFAYSTSSTEDSISDDFKGLCSIWRDLSKLSAQKAAAQIEADKPELLLNCDWHLPHSRLDISHVLTGGIPQVDYLQAGPTGIPQIPFNLTDKILNPYEEGGYWLCQKNVALDGGAHVFEPPIDAIIEPALQRDLKGDLLLGSFNHITKLNDKVVCCWSKILRANRNVRLLLKSRDLDHSEVQKRILSRFQKFGITPEQLILLGFAPNNNLNYQIYNKVSIALDPFPYNGVTTTCDALWMGVPVVTLFGDRPVARKTASLLHQIGARELIAYDEESYIEKITSLIGDEKKRIHYHQTLRSQMIASPLCDPQRLANDFIKACSKESLNAST